MPQRLSPSQFRSKLRQTQSKIKQVKTKRRQAIDKLNQKIRTYNSKARAHNARVRANQERLKRELQKLSCSPLKPQYVTFRTSVETVHQSYMTLKSRADTDAYGKRLQLRGKP